MLKVDTVAFVRETLGKFRKQDKTIALVPTMGNLHEGHLSLVREVQKLSDVCVVSIFVNPTQFVEGEDFDSYPRTMEQDLRLLESLNVDVVFTPDTEQLYADDTAAEVTVPALENIYCGEYRPGHFRGVATVVTKLFNIVQPDVAIFGRKDYQQLLVIKSLVNALNISVEIISAETMREQDGLAMSSRNQYLSDAERNIAPRLFACLTELANALQAGNRNFAELETNASAELTRFGFKPEYVSICDAATLASPKNNNLVIIAAAWLGQARLIDNVAVQTYD